MCWRSRTKSSFSGQVCQQGGPVGVQVVEVSTCWLRLISPQRTTRTEAAGGRRVTNQIWRNLMLAWPWEPRDTIGRMVATDLRHQHKPSHIYGKRWEYLPTWRSTIRELRSAINGFWRQALTIAMAIFLRVVNLQEKLILSLLCWFRFSVFCLPISFHKPLYWKNDILSSLPKRVICHLFSWRLYISTFTCIYMYTMFFL